MKAFSSSIQKPVHNNEARHFCDHRARNVPSMVWRSRHHRWWDDSGSTKASPPGWKPRQPIISILIGKCNLPRVRTKPRHERRCPLQHPRRSTSGYNESEASDAFDEITYQKGGAFLRMLRIILARRTSAAASTDIFCGIGIPTPPRPIYGPLWKVYPESLSKALLPAGLNNPAARLKNQV